MPTKWRQKKQGLWELGDDQKIIVDYLVKNYNRNMHELIKLIEKIDKGTS